MASAGVPPGALTGEEKKARLRAGEPLGFDTALDATGRTIQAEWLEELAARPSRVVRVPVEIKNAVIEGDLDLKYATFEYALSITNCEFTGTVDLSFATFKRVAVFSGSHFTRAASFRAARAEADFVLEGARFGEDEDGDFQDLNVGQLLLAAGATFGKASFDRAQIDGGAFFRPHGDKPVRFGGEARFNGAHIKGNAEFDGAQFEFKDGDAASFDGAQMDGDAIFRPTKGQVVRFEGQARFLGAHIKGVASFQGAQFEGPAAFDRAQIDGGAFFHPDEKGNPVRFKGEASCPGAHIKGQAVFDRAQFGGPALFHNAHFEAEASFEGAQFEFKDGDAASFDGAQIDGGAFFGPDENGNPVRFKGKARFLGAHIKGPATFEGAQFEGDAAFDGVQIEGDAFFRPDGGNPVRFRREAHFPAVTFASTAQFDDACFEGEALFRAARFKLDALFQGANFSGPADFSAAVAEGDAHFEGVVFKGPVDLRGFTYGRIYVAWREMMERLEPYDRQPYTQLEAAIRRTGDDRRADDVYLARRRAERKRLWSWRCKSVWGWIRDLPRGFFDFLHWVFARYGVRPYQLIGFTLAVLVLGSWLFSFPGAVTHREEKLRAKQAVQLTLLDAIAVSVNQFLPLVEIPSGSRWEPSGEPVPALHGFLEKVGLGFWFTTYASFHRLAGWFLVPLGVAALTGFLYRRPKP